eukprot:m.95493 g.95493  ORF g.95493 m.95493 type:complete len:205 (-) comp8603_c0_seq1:12-626(-)
MHAGQAPAYSSLPSVPTMHPQHGPPLPYVSLLPLTPAWINSCVGHFNHRYFFLFMAYIWTGCVYVSALSYQPFSTVAGPGAVVSGRVAYVNVSRGTQVAFTFVLTTAVTIALGLLLGWHVYLVSTAQTTIEFHTYLTLKSEAKARGERFVNPFDFGFRKNWETFFGLVEGRTFLRHVLWPSTHKPVGDGLSWRTNYTPVATAEV